MSINVDVAGAGAVPHTNPAADRLSTPVRELMRPGVITIAEHASLLQAKRAMVRHGVHAVLICGARPLGWVTDAGLLRWLERDLAAIPAAHAITEPPHFIDPDAPARDAIESLAAPGVSHLLVARAAGDPPMGVVAPLDLVDLVTHP
jgi:CBS domain-containing protein